MWIGLAFSAFFCALPFLLLFLYIKLEVCSGGQRLTLCSLRCTSAYQVHRRNGIKGPPPLLFFGHYLKRVEFVSMLMIFVPSMRKYFLGLCQVPETFTSRVWSHRWVMDKHTLIRSPFNYQGPLNTGQTVCNP